MNSTNLIGAVAAMVGVSAFYMHPSQHWKSCRNFKNIKANKRIAMKKARRK